MGANPNSVGVHTTRNSQDTHWVGQGIHEERKARMYGISARI
jgi:hypothetical protein